MIDEQEAQELKDKFGPDLVEVEFEDGTSFVFKRPSRQAYFRWVEKRDESKTASGMQLAQDCLVPPERYQSLVAALDKYPGMLICVGGVVDGITDLAGLPKEAKKAKKL